MDYFSSKLSEQEENEEFFSSMKPKVICIIMGGGRGTRLYPLTAERCKPAVPIAARYRLADIPISNCINSGYTRIFVLTQFNTASLHRHIQRSYQFDAFGGGFVEILSAEQTDSGEKWYQGTADAVRQNLHHFDARYEDDLFIILSGDQLYSMDLRKIIAHHNALSADVTVAATPVKSDRVEGYGVMRINDDYSIAEFVEKPKDPEVIAKLNISRKFRKNLRCSKDENEYCLASMGIYVFRGKVIYDALLNSSHKDFGKEIIPGLLGSKSLYAYIFDDYWEDIGTVKAFFNANLMLADKNPEWDLYNNTSTVYSRARQLPPTKVIDSNVELAVLGEGCRLTGVTLQRCTIGIRSVIGEGTKLKNVYMMGADDYDSADERSRTGTDIALGIGKNCEIINAIIDKNVRIGNNVKLLPDGKPDNYNEKGIYVKDGVLIVLKNAIIPDGTVIAPD